MKHRNSYIQHNKIITYLAAGVITMPLILLSGCSEHGTMYLSEMQDDSENQFEENTEQVSEAAKEMLRDSAGQQEVQQETKQPETGYVYICGAVENPGVYAISEDTRLYEIVDAAGGFTGDADSQWANLADILRDGQRVYIYTQEETAQMDRMAECEDAPVADPVSSIVAQENTKININTADAKQLMTLPGIGESKANAVIQYRNEHGAFTSIEEIQKISGIKNAVFSKIKDSITV